jgi:hypothetical protein
MSTTRVLLDLGSSDTASPPNNVIEVELPDGYYRVWSGALKPGDLYLNDFLARDGITTWEPVTYFPAEREARFGRPYSSANWYLCVIRRGEPVVPACERCGVEPRFNRLRDCRSCAAIVAGKG